MRIYEQLFILDPKVTEEQIDAVVAQIEDVVKGAGGSLEKVDKWGVRRLAYRVQKREEGYYVLAEFTAGTEAVREIERRLRVDENVIKYLSVRVDEKRKWLEKRKKIREKRAARRPRPVAATPKPDTSVPGAPGEAPKPAPKPAPAAVGSAPPSPSDATKENES